MRKSNKAQVLISGAGLAIGTTLAPALAQSAPLAEPFSPVFNLEAIDGTLGFEMRGGAESGAGTSMASAGDVNGDGVDDLIVGAHLARFGGVYTIGRAHILFGMPGGLPADIALESLDGVTGFAIDGVAEDDLTGMSVSGAGDLNGDGIADVIVGAPQSISREEKPGRAYVVFGRSDPFPAAIDAGALDGTDGFRFEGAALVPGAAGTRTGEVVSWAGDFNGDGRDDVAIGAPYASPAGRVYVLFGRDGDWPAVLTPDDLDGTNGVSLKGVRSNTGSALARAGDTNGDGMSDLIIAARLSGGYVVFGSAGPMPAEIDLANLDGDNGFYLDGSGEQLGAAVSGAGDINGDGVDDVAISDPTSGTPSTAIPEYFSGQTYVIYGRASGGFPRSVDVDTLDGTNGFRLDGDADEPEEFSGRDLASIGDVNGDGFDDLMIAAPTRGTVYDYSVYPPVWRKGNGAAYLIFGREGDFPATLDMGEPDGDTVVRIDGERRTFTLPIGAAGDLNADGRNDVALGVPDGFRSPGYAYVVYGRGGSCRADLDGDGTLTLFDFLAFQNLFDAGDPIADFDADGDLTLFDFLAFQNEFDAGCE